LDIKPEFTPERFREMVQPLLEGTQPSLTFQTLHRRKDGHDIPVEIFLQLVDHPSREPRFVAIVRDITERKRVEIEMRTFKAALDEHAIVAITDARGKITYVNDKFCAISKFSREELLGQDHRIINSGHHPKAFIRELWQTITSGRVWKGEIQNRAKDGTFYWVDTTIVPFVDTTGRPSQYIAIRADITVRKHAESDLNHINSQLLQAKTEADASNRAKSRFLANMSHEIRTPMNAILGYSQLMLRDPGLGTDAKANLKIINRSGEHLLALINDVLDMSKIEAGSTKLNPTTFGLSGLLDDLAGMFRLRAEAKALRFEVRVDGESVPYVADQGKIRQALINLLGNAIKFTERGYIRLHVSLDQRRAII
jgi:PAS domain S-box-containing protein